MAAWGEVLRHTEFSRITDTGDIAKYHRYLVRTAKGTTITVDIPDSANTKEQVAAILKEKALAQDSIMTL